MCVRAWKKWMLLPLVWSAALLWASGLRAADLKLQASVDRTRVEVGETVSLTVSLSSEGLGSAPEPELETPDAFQVLGSSSSSSTSINIVNGAMTTTRTVSFVYSLRALREGSFVIGPARVEHEGKRYTSSTIRVEVVKASGRKRAQPAPSPGQAPTSAELRQIEENLFVEAIPDKRRAYVGEQVQVSYKLYTRYSLQNVHYGHLPTFTGFWAETMFDAQRLDLTTEVVDGRTFNVALLKVVALFPTTGGKQTLEQLELVCDIPVRTRRSVFDFDPFDFDPFGRTQKVTVRSDEVAIEVLPLPPGAPAGFGGAVGRFQVSAEASPSVVKQGDPVSLRVRVSGTGNLNSVPEPVRPEGAPFRFYDPKASVKTEKRDGVLGGRKTFEYVVIPQETGAVKIPPLRLAYFDPAEKRYASVATAPISLTVQPGEPSDPADSAPLLSREEVRVLGEDIRYIKPDVASLSDQGEALYADWRFLVLQVVPVLAFLGIWGYARHRDRLTGDVAYARRRRARSDARRRLAEAHRLMQAGDGPAFYGEVNQALMRFLADRLNLPAAGMTGQAAAGALRSHGVAEDLAERVKEVLQHCDFIRFAPSPQSDGKMEALYTETEDLIDELGRRI